MRLLCLLFFLQFTFLAVLGQQKGDFLYATISLKNGKSYSGQVRWSYRDAAWDDLLEAYKDEPQIQEQIDIQGYEKNQKQSSEVFELSFMNLWEDKESKSRFVFKCQFGHIDRIICTSDEKSATVVLKNKRQIDLRRRTRDIGSDIVMYHAQLGKLEFDWGGIREINFSSAPARLENQLGAKIYGKALTVHGEIEGYITWDFDEEAFGADIIDGDHQDVEYQLRFDQITSIQPERNGAIVILKNGQELFMRNSSDVNKENDGIFIKTKNHGMVNVGWSNLIHISFTEPQFDAKTYSDFREPKSLKGTVLTQDGQKISGRLVYDLDESWDIEILDGRTKGTKYYLPFYLLKSISPQNFNYSLVELRDGTKLLLGDEGDVNQNNNGILVLISSSRTRYIPWEDVKTVTFN